MLCKLLIVDDNRDGADSLAMLLALYHRYDIRTVYDTDDAVETARTFAPDIVLSNYQMPKKNGHRLCDELRLICPECEVIIITGHGTKSVIAESTARGFGHLVKPADPVKLESVVHHECQLIHGKRLCV